MRRAVIVMVVMSVVAWWWLRSRHAGPPSSGAAADVAQTERVLADLAADRGGIRWDVLHPRSGGSYGLWFQAFQSAPATVTVARDMATIETSAWRVTIDLAHVTEVVCERRFIHHPPPGTVLLDVSFRKGPDDEDGFADDLFTVAFDESRDADFRALCARHGLPTVGDGW
jgi:hypothetical protein